MLRDFQLPPDLPPPPHGVAVRAGVEYLAASWTPAALADLAAALGRGAGALRGIGTSALLDAWSDAVESLLDPGSPERRELLPALAPLCRLSPAGLAAGLEAVLGGVRRQPAAALLARAAGSAPKHRNRRGEPGPVAPALVVLASNLPALAVQALLPALAAGRPVLLKSPAAEPLFAPALLAALARREPRLGLATAAVTWRGGDAALEAPLLAAAGRVVAYGGAATLADLERRAPGKLVGFGPKTSLAVVAPLDGLGPADSAAIADLAGPAGLADMAGLGGLAAVAAGVARDVALFDQRGCLSVAAVYVAGDLHEATRFAELLEAELARLALLWPPGQAVGDGGGAGAAAAAAELAAVQQVRLEAELRGLRRSALAPLAGTVLVEPEPEMRPSPGWRTVRVHPLADLDRLPGILAPWRGRLQGAALAGAAAWELAPRLAGLGVSRCAAPGALQAAGAAWNNGGVDLLQELAPRDDEGGGPATRRVGAPGQERG